MKKLLLSMLVLGSVLMGVVGSEAATQNAVLTWTDLPNETSYSIQRKIGTTGVYAQVGSVTANVVTFTDVNLVQGTNYCWNVTAVNALGSGLPSDDACMSTGGVPGKVGPVTVTITIQ